MGSLLFLGDVVGESGRRALARGLPGLIERLEPTFTIVNGENAASGNGIQPRMADAFLGLGADAVTLGDHFLDRREIGPYLDDPAKPLVRPGNASPRMPGRGAVTLEKEGKRLTVAALCGRVFLAPVFEDPFAAADRLAEAAREAGALLLLDFHAEATSEKEGMGRHLDGRAVAVLGTHTHVATADERILPGGTAYQTDVGMTGSTDGIIGSDLDLSLRRLRGYPRERLEPAGGEGVIHGAFVRVQWETGRAISIERVREPASGVLT